MPQYVYPGNLVAGTLAKASDVNARVSGLTAAVNNVDGTQLMAGVVALSHLTAGLAAQVVQSGTLPASPVAYQPWIDTGDNNRLKVYNSTTGKWDVYYANPGNPNLLFNPSFRQGLAGWSGGGSGWSASFGSDGEGGMILNTTTVNSGPNSPVIPMAAAQTFTVSADINISGMASGVAYLVISYLNNSGGTISQVSGPNPPAAAQGWNRYSSTATAPANTAAISLGVTFYNPPASQTYAAIRRIKVESGSAPTAFSDDQGANPATLLGLGTAVEETRAGIIATAIASGATITTHTAQANGLYRASAYGGTWSVTVGGTTLFSGVASGGSEAFYAASGQIINIVAGASATYTAAIQRAA